MAIFKRKNTGHRCQIDANGVTNCQIFEVSGNEKVSDGTDFSFIVSKENNCEPILVGNHDIMDKDKEKVNEIIKERANACRKGL